jgi:hypothetical protein
MTIAIFGGYDQSGGSYFDEWVMKLYNKALNILFSRLGN